MATSSPGVNINVTASSSNAGVNAPTGTWFVLGTAAGPAGVAVPINSISDFTKYFGTIVNGQVTGRYTVSPGSVTIDSTLLYDSLDVFFREGGVNAWVSRVQPTSTGTAATTGTTGGKWTLTANGKGTWANSSNSGVNGLILTITATTVGGATVYSAVIAYNGVTTAVSPALGSDTDVINWINSLPGYQSMCSAASASGSSSLPTSGNSASFYFTSGTDAAIADADSAAALAVFTDAFGPGQVSYPGSTSATVYANLTNHAASFNRVAVLDEANTATVSTLASAVTTLQGSVNDPSYASFFAPWLIVPGVVNTNPAQTSGIVFNRTVPPSALAAAKMSANDQKNDANVPAAGVQNGASSYAINLSQTFAAADRTTLNTAGVNVIRQVPNVNTIAIYGFRSAALDQNWVFLNNVRFRMQIVRDFDVVGEGFVFQEIDGKGQIFGAFAGALAGICQNYWVRRSLYGATVNDAFSVNAGPQINTPATIAAGQMNAAVNLRMSPFGELVTINVTKYSVSGPLPQ